MDPNPDEDMEFEDEILEGEEESDQDEGSINSDSEDSENERDEEEHNNLERKVVELRKELSKSPYAYNTHVELISDLKKLGELDQLRHAREAMHAVYPLSEELWLEWLKDEAKLSSTEKERENVTLLFKRAVQDYQSVPIWFEYMQFSLTGMETGGIEGLTNIRSVMEDAVRNGGLHAVKGSLLWDCYRDFELGVFQTVKDKTAEESLNQAKRVTQLYQRQLTIPLLNMESVWIEYEEWTKQLNQEVDINVKSSYEKAKSDLEKMVPFEDRLIEAKDNTEEAAIFPDYLQFEINEVKDPVRIQALYERIVAKLPLYESFWIDYYKFVNRQFKSAELTFSVLQRAVRNCTWSSSIWSDYIFQAEYYEKEPSFISGLVEKAFNAGLASAVDYRNVWLAFIDFLVRKCHKSQWLEEEDVLKVREAFSRACDHLTQAYDTEGDSECALLQYWANLEAKYLKDLPKAREIWNSIMNQGHRKSAQWWLAYIQFEKTYGQDSNEVRRLFTKSISAVCSTDWPETIVQQWIQFEREEGDWASLNAARNKCESRMKKVTEERLKKSREDGESAPAAPNNQRKRTKDDTNQFIAPPPPKKTKTQNSAANKKVEHDADKFVKPAPVASPQVEPQIDPRAAAKRPDDPTRLARTIFVSNLDFALKESDIRAVLSSSGTITDIRLVLDFKKRSKGYCYVEFSTEEEALAALKRDREPINIRPMFISRNEPDSSLKAPVFKFQSSLERKKLFVKGVNPSATKEDLEKLFSPYGILKDVRIVTYRNGLSKGIAYVEFEDVVSASTALTKTDGTTFMEHVLEVALSNPPPRQMKYDSKSLLEPSLGGGTRERKSQVSFVPNSVLKQKTVQQPIAAAKSNADFRSLLLNQK